MSATLNYLLAHKIARNEELPQAVLDVVELLLTVQLIQTCELEEGTAGPIMKRSASIPWNKQQNLQR